MKKWILVLSSWLPILLHGQTFLGFEYDASIPVTVGSSNLSNAWAGGINFGQFSSLDFDFDGDDDLVIFDRSGDEFILLEHVQQGGTHFYRYVFNGASYFPEDCKYRSAFLDYDNDGRNDLFSYGVGGIKVYRNVGDASNGLSWQLVAPIVESDYVGSVGNLFVSASDIPAYVDVDFDGDIDVLTFNLGGEYLQYHQNQSMELYGIPDSLIFELKNQCWGKFSEDPNSNAVFLNVTQYPCTNGDVPNPQREAHPGKTDSLQTATRHSGSTLLALDLDNNGVMDLILGDVSYSNLTMLMNGGTAPNTNSAMTSQDNNYPSYSNSVELQLFPAMYWEDVDFDGKKDLIVAPNARTVSENQQSVWFYKNTGTNQNPVFIYQRSDLFQSDMIDAGLGSIPVLVDYNSDGLTDLLVANLFRYKPVLDKESAFMLFENTGTATQPAFTLVDNDYLNMSSQGLGLRIVPTFGDLDNDGDLDMIVGKDNGTLLMYTNTAGAGNNLAYGTPVTLTDQGGATINVSAYAHPQLFDLNKDGLIDLMVGKKTGEISYYQNTGTAGSPIFQLISNNLGQVDISATPDGYAAPFFFRVHDTTHLFVGNYNGTLTYYSAIDGHLTDGDTFHLVNDQFLNLNVGLYSSFAVADLDGDGLLNMIAGQDLGGLFHFEADPNSILSLQEKNPEPFFMYPNPASGEVHFTETIENGLIVEHITIYDMQGKKVIENRQTASISVAGLPQGAYFVDLQYNKGNQHFRLIKN